MEKGAYTKKQILKKLPDFMHNYLSFSFRLITVLGILGLLGGSAALMTSHIFTIYAQQNTAPVVTIEQSTHNATPDENLSFPVTASDAEGDYFTLHASGLTSNFPGATFTGEELPRPPLPKPGPAALQPTNLEYLGHFLPPLRTAEDTAAADAKLRQFAFSPGHAALGPNGLFMAGHIEGTYVAEISIPEPSKTNPPRATFIQPFTDIGLGGRGDTFRVGGATRPRLKGLYTFGDQLLVTWGQHYNVAHNQYPTVSIGPTDLSRNVSDGTPLLWVYDEAGNKVDHEKVAGTMAETPLGFALTAAEAKHNARSDGPALYTIDIPNAGADRITGFKEHMRYERASRIFPDPLFLGLGGWNEKSNIAGFATVKGTLLYAGNVGLGTGLEEYQGSHTEENGTVWSVNWNSYYGGPGNYPVEGVNICAGPGAKGYHSPPYESRLWFYDPSHITSATSFSEPLPYAIMNLSTDELLGYNEGCGNGIASIVYDEAKQRIYLATAGSSPVIHVFAVN